MVDLICMCLNDLLGAEPMLQIIFPTAGLELTIFGM